MSKTLDVAVVGATTLVGEILVELLEQRKFPLGQLRLLDWGDAVGKRISFRESHIPIQEIAGFDFSTVGLALFCGGEEIAAEFVPQAVEAGCVVIDHSAQYRNAPDIPLVIPEINPQAIAAYSQRGIIASPAAATVQMLLCVHPLHTVGGLEHISVTVCEAASEHGRAGVEELAGQTANLLNMRPIESQFFPQQIAFNVLPLVGALEENGYSISEAQLVRESQKILNDPALKVSPTILQVPVFFGHGMVLGVQTQKPIALEQARDLLEKSSVLEVVDPAAGGPTAVTEAAGNDAIYVGRLRADISLECGITLWAVADNSRKGTALNGVQIAEILVKDYL
jgi:aspartate-semialdehyde dehydrogenase